MSLSTSRRQIIAEVNPKSPISEAYRTLRTNIDFSAIDSEVKTVMVTSAGMGEGKSTTVSNLAITYAQVGKQVLLIDADMRKPTIHHTFQVTNRMGLSNVLANQCELKDAIQRTHIRNLDILPSGPIPPNPSELLASNRMSERLGQLKSEYDIILIDTPPTLAVTDSQVVATKCDGVLIVIDSGKVKRDIVLKVKSSLEHVQARILGIVLNNVERKKRETYYYYYE